ncbi:hypothetical protein LWI29_006468 [Acer saccharum]|uniref:Bifunctional inhibitor/plant lipid transfer protein/seed storage helical domain-containing protein n=1 Tax=Acer saccharum TaxID=4024 RepID=A0AA39SBN3_ACESA|nr:hypothetical protein LWI29_006468 [Acer saccharum]
MGSKALASTALLVSLNLLFFSLVSSTSTYCSSGTCPDNALNLNACVDLLGLLKLRVNSPNTYPCCSLIKNLVSVNAAACLCTTLRTVNLPILGPVLDIPLSLTLLLNTCGKPLPDCSYQCA